MLARVALFDVLSEVLDVWLEAWELSSLGACLVFIVLGRLSECAKFVDDRRQRRHFRQLEVLVVVGVKWDAYVACLGMDAEWRFQKMVNAVGDVGIQSWVQVGEHECVDVRWLLGILRLSLLLRCP